MGASASGRRLIRVYDRIRDTDLDELFCDSPDEEQAARNLGNSGGKWTSDPAERDMKHLKDGKALNQSCFCTNTEVGCFGALVQRTKGSRKLRFKELNGRNIQEWKMREPAGEGSGG
jgi:hypothetical protein